MCLGVMERHHYKQRAVHLTVTEESYLSVNLSEAVSLCRSNNHSAAADAMKNTAGEHVDTQILPV